MKRIIEIDSDYLPILPDRLYLKQLGTILKAFACRLLKVIEQSQSVDIFRGEVKSGKEFRSISLCHSCNEDSENDGFEPWDPSDSIWMVETIPFSAFSTCYICEQESSDEFDGDFESMIRLRIHNVEYKPYKEEIRVSDLHMHMLEKHNTLSCFGKLQRPEGDLKKLIELIGLPPGS